MILDEEAGLSDGSENIESNKESLVEITTKPESNSVKKKYNASPFSSPKKKASGI